MRELPQRQLEDVRSASGRQPMPLSHLVLRLLVEADDVPQDGAQHRPAGVEGAAVGLEGLGADEALRIAGAAVHTGFHAGVATQGARRPPRNRRATGAQPGRAPHCGDCRRGTARLGHTCV